MIAWLWFTLLFANFAEGIAEAQGKARADSLRSMRNAITAHLARGRGKAKDVRSSELRSGDLVVCEAGDLIPGDGEVVEGVASVDESAITGESAPVIREAGGDRSGVTGGTRVISDRIVIRITADPGEGFVDKMILMVENATRQKTPGEIALTILLASLTMIFLIAVVTLYPFSQYIANESKAANVLSILKLTTLLVCLIPTTIGGLLSAIGISGVSRLMRKNVMALSGRAIEAAGDIDVLLLDKTGTITYGNRMATELIAAKGVTGEELADGRPRCLPGRRDAGGQVDRRPHRRRAGGAVRRGDAARRAAFRALQRLDEDERRRLSAGAGRRARPEAGDPQGRPLRRAGIRGGARRQGAAGGRERLREDSPLRGHAPRGLGRQSRPRRHPPQGRGQAGHTRALRGPPRDGHTHGDDHRRQPPHRGRHSRGIGGLRFHRRGQAREQARGHQAASSAQATSSA